jgi:hypothetical protein
VPIITWYTINVRKNSKVCLKLTQESMSHSCCQGRPCHKMVTLQQKAFCILQFAKTNSVTTVHWMFCTCFRINPPARIPFTVSASSLRIQTVLEKKKHQSTSCIRRKCGLNSKNLQVNWAEIDLSRKSWVTVAPDDRMAYNALNVDELAFPLARWRLRNLHLPVR